MQKGCFTIYVCVFIALLWLLLRFGPPSVVECRALNIISGHIFDLQSYRINDQSILYHKSNSACDCNPDISVLCESDFKLVHWPMAIAARGTTVHYATS